MPRPPSTPRPPADGRTRGSLLVALQFILIAAIILGPRGARLAGADRIEVLAIVAAVAGVGLAVWGALALGPAFTPHPSPRPGAPLVRSGPFAWVSHPIYIGLGLAGIAAAILREGILPLAAALVLCLFLFFKARYEERLLREAHGSRD